MAERWSGCHAPAPRTNRGGCYGGPPRAAGLTEGCPPFDSVSPQGAVWWHAAGPPAPHWATAARPPRAADDGRAAVGLSRPGAPNQSGGVARGPGTPNQSGGVARGPAARRGLGHGTPPRYPTGLQPAEPQAGGGPLRAAGRSAWMPHTHIHPRTRPHTHDTHVAIAIAIAMSFHRHCRCRSLLFGSLSASTGLSGPTACRFSGARSPHPPPGGLAARRAAGRGACVSLGTDAQLPRTPGTSARLPRMLARAHARAPRLPAPACARTHAWRDSPCHCCPSLTVLTMAQQTQAGDAAVAAACAA